ncbi:hypothetical protein DAI22_06g094800 [Oryza sativa Japonica Group]|nr:hypothetical protein DAI22_06g094800 [Oryza sativa Japonica Group]
MAGRHTSHTMEHKLLKAVATGDADLLAQALGIWPTATAEQGDVDQSCCLKGVTAEGSSVLHIAASRGHLKLVVMICTHDISLIKSRNNQLDTPLICAARAGHADVVDYLVRAASAMQEPERSVLRAWNSGGATAMHEAVRNGYAPVLQKLMSSDSGLATAVLGGCVQPARYASYAGPDGKTALHAAVYIGKEMSESLRRWEPTLAEKVDIDGRTALHYAVLTGETGLVELLLDNSSAAYIPDNDGLFPVHVAAIAGKASVTRMLMEMCLNCDELLDNKQRNVLHCAVEYGRLMVVWYICRNPKFTRLLNAGDCEGNTPLHLAVKHGNAIIISCLMMNTRVNLSIINHGGSTPLDVAFNKSTRYYSLSWVRFLCHAFCSFNILTSITMCLQACNAYTSRFLNRADKRFLEDKEESSVYTNVSQSILCISVLIAAGSFAAAFTPPGGYIADGEDAGMPLLKEYAEFSSYVAANSMSFYCSTFATCLLVHDSLTRRRRRYLSLSAGLVFLAVVGMVLTFLVVTTDLTLDSGNSWDDLIFSITVGVFVFLLMFGRVIFVLSILAIPICWRLPMQLWRGNHLHFWQDILKVIAAAIFLVYVSLGFLMTVFSVLEVVLAFFFVEIENVTPSSIEFCSWHGCVIQHGDLIALYPS